MGNIVAVLVAAVAQFALGMLWYGPLLGKVWMKEMGITPKNMKSMKMKASVSMALGFVMAIVLAYGLKSFIKLAGEAAFTNVSFWVWLSFMGPLIVGAALWENRSWKLVGINAAYWLISVFVMGWILTAMM